MTGLLPSAGKPRQFAYTLDATSIGVVSSEMPGPMLELR
jgi:hypothetical protein